MILHRSLALGFALALVSCGPAGQGGIAQNFAALLGRDKGPSPRFQALQHAGAAMMIVSVVERRVATLFLLEARRDGVESWLSPDDVAILLEDGFVLGTRGLGDEMMTAEVSASRALVMAGQGGQVERFHAMLTGDNQIETRSFVCDITARGPREVDTGTGNQPALLMEETCHNPEIDFVNLYWVGASGREILQSRQWVGGFTKYLALRKVTR